MPAHSGPIAGRHQRRDDWLTVPRKVSALDAVHKVPDAGGRRDLILPADAQPVRSGMTVSADSEEFRL